MKNLVGLLVLVAGVASAAMPQSEQDVLIALYNSTNGDSWLTKTNWKSATGGGSDAGTECTWYGISCTRDAATKIYLAANRLTGSIPSLNGQKNLNSPPPLKLFLAVQSASPPRTVRSVGPDSFRNRRFLNDLD